jgi:hypothetical protein
MTSSMQRSRGLKRSCLYLTRLEIAIRLRCQQAIHRCFKIVIFSVNCLYYVLEFRFPLCNFILQIRRVAGVIQRFFSCNLKALYFDAFTQTLCIKEFRVQKKICVSGDQTKYSAFNRKPAGIEIVHPHSVQIQRERFGPNATAVC